MSNIGTFKSEAAIFDQALDIYNKDLVVTVDYTAWYSTLSSFTYGGFVFGVFPYFCRTAVGSSAGDGLAYSSVSALSSNGVSLSATGINFTQLGAAVDFGGTFGLSGAVGTGGIAAPVPNSLCIRSASPDYQYVASTNNLSTFSTPFSSFDFLTPTTQRSIRFRISDFGNRLLVDCKQTPTADFTNYLNSTIPTINYKYINFYIGFAGPQDLNFNISNINVNGYNVTINYLLSGASYVGLLSSGNTYYPIPPNTFLNKGDILTFVNDLQTTSTLFSSFSSLGTLLLVGSGGNMPYVPGNSYVDIQYSII